MKVFLSHSVKDKEIALKFMTLIEECCDDASVFCSSDEGAIRVGKNFVDDIYKNLENSDVFIPLLTADYYKSRFCMIELGTSVAYLYRRYDKNGGDYICPFCVSPNAPGNALYGTPISQIEVADLCDKSQVQQLLRQVIKTGKAINTKVEEFVHDIESIIIQRDKLLENASRVFSCAGGEKVFKIDWNDFSNSSVSLVDNRITTNFNLNPYELKKAIKPDFISTVLQYIDNIDLLKYLFIRPNAEFKFTFNNFTNSVKGINVELKYGESKNILNEPVQFKLEKGKTECSFSLDKFKCNKLSQVCEICFVANKSYFIENEGTFIIENIRIE